ncbi:diaminopimelate epimerase [Lactobacillus colini]|uniref:Diaminopimelate epimerase n=1 Tax=Lactobacillus colini TaxID=1819254 RepID=A0ABS4MB49_9LACO|nr:diaminopimelate epimerase [Lactobacillus colini]MBP2056901.1 diaminopimelate epimerase [Lactobacillus colini]
MQLLKVHGSQNQFFILDQTKLQNQLTDEELVVLAKKITSPTTGILNGSDGVLVVNNSKQPNALGQMRVINADGSEASMCGNGLRTVARYLSEKYNQDEFEVETLNANLHVSKQADLAKGVPSFAVEISPVKFDQKDIPFANLGHQRIIDQFIPELYPGLKFTSIAVPNPHLISFVNHEVVTSDILGAIGKALNSDNPYYYDGVNVNLAQIIDKNRLFVRTFERGVGFTNACGTGMSATSLALCLTHPEMGELGTPIEVYNPGGMVKVTVHYDHQQYWMDLIGNATFTDKIEIDESDLHNLDFSKIKVESTGEQNNYEKFVSELPNYNNL